MILDLQPCRKIRNLISSTQPNPILVKDLIINLLKPSRRKAMCRFNERANKLRKFIETCQTNEDFSKAQTQIDKLIAYGRKYGFSSVNIVEMNLSAMLERYEIESVKNG